MDLVADLPLGSRKLPAILFAALIAVAAGPPLQDGLF
jgi:hypothetical protein